ncbi:hypothetical protein VB773_04855 [Haloarculaceae archaeon H-GB2-1]|nr:hypothetical protein [Haloarculaceae archaeon H-GB1-1]MEA5406971.1 hypothetical protein [Haloarculaceae archaeon H-GB2-1]
MEEAAAIRRAALEAVEDVEPETLRERIEGHIADGSMAPGVLTILSARACRDTVTDAVPDGIAERGAGVQLIYDGLRLTRSLAREVPWTEGDGESVADLSILVADILVARGFYLLACTQAADSAVETVRAFGRDQTIRRATDDTSLDENLEADVFELAVIAGTTASGERPTAQLREFVAELARTDGDLGVARDTFPKSVRDRLSTLSPNTSSNDGVRTPTTENRNA